MSIAEKLTTITENEKKVFDAGKKEERKEIWDMIQQNGQRSDYSYGFSNWYGDNFKPKYDIRPTERAAYMFSNFKSRDGGSINLVKLLEEAGIAMDLGGITSTTGYNYMIRYSDISHLGTIDISHISTLSNMLYAAEKLKQVYLKVNEGTLNFANNIFEGSPNVEDFQIVSGVLGRNVPLGKGHKLSKTSIISVINALSDSGTGYTVTFSKTAINKAFGIDIDDETTYPEGSEYYILRNSKPNWTFSYLSEE